MACHIYITFGEDARSDDLEQFRFCWFKSGNECINDEQHQSHSETCIEVEIKQYLMKQRLNSDESTIRKLHANKSGRNGPT